MGYVVLNVRMIVNDELGRSWREAVMVYCKHLTEGIEEIHEISQSG
jgi:hypothetical protein